ncbi:Glutaredoxin domain-containing protein [Heracleum sosnowskyi]|uniref:Glutaredoxin domain-containing protein n=1 Tax=Heracleum sosnowskyi TaxID=360622 RepID=A0AAD8MNV2_9APIA|nr:Glutaredoxin domain-containing protein [Heracleum sosnowskyi]
MGCATSKQQKHVCRKCQEPLPSLPRSYSMHVHHLPQSESDTYHVVALTSTTLGSLKPDSFGQAFHFQNFGDQDEKEKRKEEELFSMGLIEAKTWSKMIDEKLPKVVSKTPIETPPGEPEMINAWELMEGLEDISSPLHKNNRHFRSYSFSFGPKSDVPTLKNQTPKVHKLCKGSPRPLWMELEENDSDSDLESDETSIVSGFDPDVISEFRKSLEKLPPDNLFHLKALEGEKVMDDEALDVRDFKTFSNACKQDKAVLYFTSLRGIRKTYEDCCTVRAILKGLKIKVDERDVSMHSGFKDELKELLGDGFGRGGLPRVFVGNKYVGGAEEIQKMNDEGQLEKFLEGCEKIDDRGGFGNGSEGRVCQGCGDVRFMPCETCSGSCKIYYEVDYDEYCEEEGECGFQRCPDCNENGLVRCRICCD